MLIVDNDETRNFVTSHSLKKHNKEINIEIKKNGLETCEFINETNCDKFSVVLLDINMPIMNGFEFLDRYGKSVCIGKMKIAMFSTSNQDEDKKMAMEYKDVITLFQKPLDQNKIQLMLNKINVNYG